MKSFYKKVFAVVFITIFLFLAAPNTTFAVWGVGDTVIETNPLVWLYNILTSANTNVTAVATTAQVGETLFEWAFRTATEVLKKQLLDMMVDQIVNWIQGGGDPKFITDWPGFFRDALDQAGGKFIQQIGLSQLCSPFKPLLGAGFIPIPTFTTRTSCTLSRIGVNIDVFLKDFKQGNWIAWQEMVLRPQNNIYGAYVLAWDQYEIEKSAAAKASAAEAQAGKGFLSAKKCVQWDRATIQACSDECPLENADPTSCYASCQRAGCTKEIDVTPGSVIGDLASKAIGSDIDYIVNAEDLAAYVGAITNAILNRMFAEGIGLLHTAVSGDAGGGGGGGSSAQAQCAQFLGTAAYNDCITALQTGTDMREFQKNHLISLIDQDLAYQNQLLGAKQATLIVLNQSVDILNQLNNCDGSATATLGRVQSTASTTASQIAEIQSDIIALQVKQQEIKAITDIRQIASLWSQVSSMVNPTITYSLAISAQEETNQKQQEMNIYQQQLTFCLQPIIGI